MDKNQEAGMFDINLEDKDDERTLPDVPWTEEHENILIDWADKAMCYRWMHSKANQGFSRKNAWYTIPVIIMSTLTGTANFAVDRFPENIKYYAPMMIGAVNIFAGILTTIQQFLKIGELNEAHRVASISWDKFYRNIKVELAKHPRERTSVSHMLKTAKEEFDRLMETSPDINDNIINMFQNTFTNLKDPSSERARAFNELKKPEICDSLESTKYSVYKMKTEQNKGLSTTMMDLIKKKREETRKAEIVENFIINFRKEYSREPSTDEIYENLKEQVAQDIVNKVVGRMSNTVIPKQNNTNLGLSKTASIMRNALGVINAKKVLGEDLSRNPDEIV